MRSYLILLLICICLIPKEYWAPFHVPIDNLNIFFGKMSSNVFCPFLNLIICFFFLLSCMNSLHILYVIKYMVYKYFLPSLRLSFHYVEHLLCFRGAFSFMYYHSLIFSFEFGKKYTVFLNNWITPHGNLIDEVSVSSYWYNFIVSAIATVQC